MNSNSIQCIWIQFRNLDSIQFKLQYNVVHTLIFYRNELVFLISRTFQKKSWFTMMFVFSFFNIFNVGANKEDLLHGTHYIISSLITLWMKSIYINMSCHWHMNLCVYVDIVQKIINKEVNVNAKDDNDLKFFLHLACGNNHCGRT